MASTEKKTKHAGFHRAYILQDGARRDPGEQDWQDLLRRVAALKIDERTVNDVIYEPASELSIGTLLGMHKPINPDFMSTINSKAGKVADLMKSTSDDDEEEDGPSDRFANSTAVCFLPVGNVFAVALGNAQAPRASQLAYFLDEFLPAEEKGAYWKTEPLVDDDEIRKLRQAKGLVEFSSKFNTARNLFTMNDESSGVVSFGERIAQRVGGDVEITIEVKLKPSARNTSVKQKMLDLVMHDLPTLAGKGSNAKAKALMSEGIEEELSLVEHNLAADFEIDRLGSESHQFSELLQALGDVSADMETKVKSILEGSD
jgi:hypothetical protein